MGKRGKVGAKWRLLDNKTFVLWRDRSASQRFDEARRRGLSHFEIALVRCDPDSTDIVAPNVAVAADERKQPAWVGIVASARVYDEPCRAFEPFTLPSLR